MRTANHLLVVIVPLAVIYAICFGYALSEDPPPPPLIITTTEESDAWAETTILALMERGADLAQIHRLMSHAYYAGGRDADPTWDIDPLIDVPTLIDVARRGVDGIAALETKVGNLEEFAEYVETLSGGAIRYPVEDNDGP